MEKMNKKWSEEELKFLKEKYSKLSPKKLAETLDRTIRSVHSK